MCYSNLFSYKMSEIRTISILIHSLIYVIQIAFPILGLVFKNGAWGKDVADYIRHCDLNVISHHRN